MGVKDYQESIAGTGDLVKTVPAWVRENLLPNSVPLFGVRAGASVEAERHYGSLAEAFQKLTPAGARIILYQDGPLMLFLAKELGRPVSWVDTREGLAVTTVHCRGQIQYGTLAGTKDGKITALSCTNYVDFGAYPASNGHRPPAERCARRGLLHRSRCVITATFSLGTIQAWRTWPEVFLASFNCDDCRTAPPSQTDLRQLHEQ